MLRCYLFAPHHQAGLKMSFTRTSVIFLLSYRLVHHFPEPIIRFLYGNGVGNRGKGQETEVYIQFFKIMMLV